MWNNIIEAFFAKDSVEKYSIITVEDEMILNSWGIRRCDEGSQRNDLLQKAILLYINEKNQQIKYNNAVISFTSISDENNRNDYDDGYNSSNGTLNQFKKFGIHTMPPKSIWITIEPGNKFLSFTYIINVVSLIFLI